MRHHQPADGLAVVNFAAHDHFKRFFQRQAAKPEELVFIRQPMRPARQWLISITVEAGASWRWVN